MSDKNIKDRVLEYSESNEAIVGDDGVIAWSEPADEIAFARLARRGYTIVRDDDGKIIAAIHPDSPR